MATPHAAAVLAALKERGRPLPALGRGQNEEAIQRAVFLHLAARAAPGLIAWHTPNGGTRSKATAARLKGMGTLAGIPDILALYNDRLYALELKDGRGRRSETQVAIMARLEAAGAIVATAHGLDGALRTLEGWGLLRAARSAA